MTDVLNQNEVEALLSALNPTGEKEAKPAPAPVFDDDETSIYDFKRPERVGKDQIRALQSVHDSFSRNLSAMISGLLRTIVEVKLISVDQVTYSEFIFSLENPTCFNLIEAKPLDGHIILDLNPSILYPIIDRMLGGGSSNTILPGRPLTEIELRLVRRITDLVLEALQAAWANICALELEIVQVESNAQLVQIVPPNEVVVLVSFEVTLGEVRGMVNLCIPFNALEPVIGKLSSDTWFLFSKRGSARDSVEKVGAQLRGSAVQVTVHLAETQLTASEIMNLEVGDIITTDKDAKSGLLVSMEGVPKFRAEAGSHKGKKAVRILETVPSTARINQ